MSNNLKFKLFLLVFFTIALFPNILNVNAEELKTPIHIVFEMHSHEDDIIRAAGGTGFFEDHKDVFLTQLESVEWLLDKVDEFGAKISFLSVGPWAELCLDESLQEQCFPLIQRLYDSGEMIGTHSHNYRFMGDFNQWDADRKDSTGRNNWQYVNFVNLLIENALGVSDEDEISEINLAGGFTKPKNTILKHQLLKDNNFQIKQGGEEQVFLLYYNHLPFNPFRVGDASGLSEDLEEGLFTIPQYPIFNSKIRAGAAVDSSLGHQKAMFLQVLLNWRDSDEPKIWTYGWGTHVHNIVEEPDTRERIDNMLTWLSTNFIDKKSNGSVIAQYYNYKQVLNDYENWENEHPGVSSFEYNLDHTDYSEYPYNKWVNHYLRNSIVVDDLILEKKTKAFLLESNESPLILAFSDNSKTDLNFEDYFSKNVRIISLLDGTFDLADPSSIVIGSDAVVICLPMDCKKILDDDMGLTLSEVSSLKKIPSGVKENAKLWANDEINNKTFVKSITFLIKEKIIVLPFSSDPVKTPIDEIFPLWFKDLAGWWGDDLVNDDKFVVVLQYLINYGIIKL